MKRLRKLTALLSAGVLAFCGASLMASAAEESLREEFHKKGAEPVYALGTDLSLYPKGDADLDGEVTVYDSYLILAHSNYSLCCLPDLLNPDQVEVADADGKSLWIESDQKWERLTPLDSVYVLRYANLQMAGINVTMEDVVAGNY